MCLEGDFVTGAGWWFSKWKGWPRRPWSTGACKPLDMHLLVSPEKQCRTSVALSFCFDATQSRLPQTEKLFHPVNRTRELKVERLFLEAHWHKYTNQRSADGGHAYICLAVKVLLLKPTLKQALFWTPLALQYQCAWGEKGKLGLFLRQQIHIRMFNQ